MTSTNANAEPVPIPVEVRTLGLPVDARRIWRAEPTGALVVRDLAGFGPQGYIPVGYVAEGVVVPETAFSMSALDIAFITVSYASHQNAVPPVPANGGITHPGVGPRCLWCHQSHGLPHAADCRHAGKNAGDRVR